jgi:hypothetical protein
MIYLGIHPWGGIVAAPAETTAGSRCVRVPEHLKFSLGWQPSGSLFLQTREPDGCVDGRLTGAWRLNTSNVKIKSSKTASSYR